LLTEPHFLSGSQQPPNGVPEPLVNEILKKLAEWREEQLAKQVPEEDIDQIFSAITECLNPNSSRHQVLRIENLEITRLPNLESIAPTLVTIKNCLLLCSLFNGLTTHCIFIDNCPHLTLPERGQVRGAFFVTDSPKVLLRIPPEFIVKRENIRAYSQLRG